MLVAAISAFYHYKVVGSVIILACWGNLEQTKFFRQLSKNNVRAIFSCDLSALDTTNKHGVNGVLFFNENSSNLLNKTKWEHFSTWYKWLIIGEEIPEFLSNVRYDADIAFIVSNKNADKVYNIFDVYVHMSEGISLHPWATWSDKDKLNLTHENERIQRRNNLRGYPMKLSTPNGLYSPQEYPGTFEEYIKDVKNPESEQALRRSYACTVLMCESFNATVTTVHTYLHNSENDNSSMYSMVSTGRADFGGNVLRITRDRVLIVDYIMALWSLSVGFTYIAERESSSNMYVEPFSTGVWLCFLGTGMLLALALRVTARQEDERRDAAYTAVASCLQQDANTVPLGVSGRTVFLTLSVCSMLVHAYYTSAVVSALMNSGRGGPRTLRELADSKLTIAAENYDWMKYSLFEVNFSADMTYLKTKKMTTNFYQPADKGIDLIAKGGTAYHTEYNSLYSQMSHLTDEQVCRLQQIDTISPIMTYIVATKRSQFYNVASSKGLWISETGLAKRTLSWWQSRQPKCLVTVLAERVTFGDVAPVITTVVIGAILSFFILACEIFVAHFRNAKNILN